MMWLSWRLHRAAVLTFTVVVGGLIALYLVDSIRLQDVYRASGLDECVGVLNSPSCAARRQLFLAYDVGLLQYTSYVLAGVTTALGAFLGAPLVSTEFERGTWQWIWTQRISRTRWLAVNVAVISVIVVGFGVTWARRTPGGTGRWRRRQALHQHSRLRQHTPLMCAVFGLFAFDVGVAASAFLRRTLAAIGVTVAVFLATRFTVLYWLRERYMAPLAVESPAKSRRPLAFDAPGLGLPQRMDRRVWPRSLVSRHQLA